MLCVRAKIRSAVISAPARPGHISAESERPAREHQLRAGAMSPAVFGLEGSALVPGCAPFGLNFVSLVRRGV